MNKTLRFTLVSLLMMLCGTVFAGSITFGNLSLENGVQYSDPFDGGDFTVTFAGGGNDGKYYNTGAGIRVYGNGTMTVTAKSGNITSITVTYDGSYKPTDGDVVSVGTYDATTGIWTGEASSVVFTRPSGTGHWRVKSIEVTTSGGTTQTTVAKPVFSPNGGEFEDQVEVTLSCATNGATIYYAVANAPALEWTEYDKPIVLTETTILNAKAVKDNTESDVASATFTKFEVQTVTIANFNAAEVNDNVWYQLTGTVKNLTDGDQYGNFDIEDETGSVYVYGLRSEKGGATKQFQTLVAEKGIKNGSVLTLIGTRGYYAKDDKIEVLNAYFVSVDNSSLPKEAEYYVVGNMTGWQVNENYKMARNTAATSEEYMLETTFAAGDEIKVVKDDVAGQTWYPDNGDNYTISAAGDYTVYFRPDGDGGNDWHYGYIYAYLHTEKNVTFDFNKSEHAVSTNESHDGDIVSKEVFVEDGVTMTIAPHAKGTPNRFWSTNNGPQLRMYGGKLTVVAPNDKTIKKATFNGSWNNNNTLNGVTAESKVWEGNSTNLVLDVAANTQLNSVVVTIDNKNSETTTYTPTFTATFTTDLWNNVHAYAYSGEKPNVTKFLGDWPGTELTLDAETGKYNVAIVAIEAPDSIMFNNGIVGDGAEKTTEFEFVDGKEYSYTALDKAKAEFAAFIYYIQSMYDEYKYVMPEDSQREAEDAIAAAWEAYNDPNATVESIAQAQEVFMAAAKKAQSDALGLNEEVTNKFSQFEWQSDLGDVTVNKDNNLSQVWMNTTDGTGKVIYKTVTGLENGTYEVKIEGQALWSGNGEQIPAQPGEIGRVVIFANNIEKSIPVEFGDQVGTHHFQFGNVVVGDDRTMELGIKAIAPGSDRYLVKLEKVKMLSNTRQVGNEEGQNAYWRDTVAVEVLGYEAYNDVTGEPRENLANATTKEAVMAAIPVFYASKPAPQNAEINSVVLCGEFNNWTATDGTTMTKGETENVWSMTLDLSDIPSDQKFKLLVNGELIGNGHVDIDAPSGWVDSAYDQYNNLVLYNSKTGYKTYNVTATWTPNTSATEGWALKFEGKDERTEITYPEITSVELRGTFNNWVQSDKDVPFILTKGETENVWMATLDLSNTSSDQEFKLVVNGEWLGDGELEIDAPDNWIVRGNDGNNFLLNNSTTGYKTYNVTATWMPNANAKSGWTLKFEGKDERTEITYPEITCVELRGDFNGWPLDVNSGLIFTKEETENVWTATLDLTNRTDDTKFKLVVNGEWMGYHSNTVIVATDGWVINAKDSESDDYLFNHSVTGYNTYTVTATWEPNANANSGWTLTFEGKDEKTPVVQNYYSAIFKTNADWDKVYAYAWSGEKPNVTEFFGVWPGKELGYNEKDRQYELGFYAEVMPDSIIFNNGLEGDAKRQTENLAFVNQNMYEYYVEEPVIPEYIYAVVGKGSIFATEWDEANAPDQMTLDEETGLYKWSVSKVLLEPQTIEFKVIKKAVNVNETTKWYPEGDNMKFEVAEANYYNIDIFFNTETSEVSTNISMREKPNYAENNVYYWESPDGIVNENLGKAVHNNAAEGTTGRVNYTQAGYHTICLNGKSDYTSDIVTITLDEGNELKAGDEIAITAFRNKDVAGKKSAALLKFDDGSTINTGSGLEFVNLNEALKDTEEYGTEPNTINLVVPETAEGSKTILMTRGQTGTNLFITKLEINRPVSLNTYTATFTTNAGWDEVYAYAWSEEGENEVRFLGDWPGTKLTAADGVYTATIEAAEAPAFIIFNNGVGAQTADLAFENGKAYEFTINNEWAEAIAAAEALADPEAVAVGKLIEAINKAKGIAEPNDDQKAVLQSAVDQFKADNADTEKDETAKVGTGVSSWTGASGTVPDWAGPAVTTYDGRTVPLIEHYNGGSGDVTGEIFSQTITGLQNGAYKVAFYANANSTADRDAAVETGMEDGAEDVAYVFANDAQKFLVAHRATSLSTYGNGEYAFEMELTDTDNGTIKLGMAKAKAGTNWHTMQIKQLTWFTTAKEVYAADQAELAGLISEAEALTGTADRTALDEAIAEAKEATAAKKNWYNVAEIEEIMAKLKGAKDAFVIASRFTYNGVAYIIDVESGKFMAAGHDYGTRGIVNNIGLDLTFSANSDNTVDIETGIKNSDTNHFLGSNLYMDSSSYGWILLEQDFGFYITDVNGQYISVDANDNLVMSNTPHLWLIVTPEGVKEQRLEDMKEATATNPVDVTWMIKGQGFNRNDVRTSTSWTTWSEQEGGNENLNISGGSDANRCAESYHAHFYVKQTIEGAPAGLYKMTAQGFYRQDDEATEDAPVFFIGSKKAEVPLKGGSENSMSDASESFTNGQYAIEPIEFKLFADGNIELGVKQENAFHQWVIFDNFTLEYCGPVTADFYVAGGYDTTEGDKEDLIFGTTWNPTLNKMTANDDGTYTFVKSKVDLQAGKTILYKVVADGDWDYSWGFGDNNADFVVETDANYDVVIKFNPSEKFGNGYNLYCDLKEGGSITTGISTIAAEAQNGNIYNLNGQKMEKAKKGLYIVNGRKVVIK